MILSTERMKKKYIIQRLYTCEQRDSRDSAEYATFKGGKPDFTFITTTSEEQKENGGVTSWFIVCLGIA